MSSPRIDDILDKIFLLFWASFMSLIGLAIYKFAFFDTLLGWDYPNWKIIDWIIYIAGVCVYGYFWLYLSIRIPREVQKRHA